MVSCHPLSGLVVVEIGHSIAAPYAGMILAELGALVVKVENPKGGDPARGWGPPFSAGAATCFQAFNRGKHGVTVDLADPEDAGRLHALIRERADVLLHNLKFGALDRFGLSAPTLLAEKPALVYCPIGAFGTRGPLRTRPGYDPMMQAYGGLMSLLGEEGRPPVRVGVSIVDIATGLWAVVGILAALQERNRTGKGGLVDVSLYETTLAWMTLPITTYLANREIPKRHGSGIEQIVPYQAFAAADGFLMVAAGNDNLFRRLAAAIGRPSLADDPRFRTNPDRVVHRKALVAILSDLFATEPVRVWAQTLESAGIPYSPIQNVAEVVADPQTAALGMIEQAPGAALSLMGLPLSFDGVRPPLEKLAPKLGEDNAEFLAGGSAEERGA
jgi:crotonobetainyl-CoA:carnitine CoA-transferase CaiB-like acyl-CoA transferase